MSTQPFNKQDALHKIKTILAAASQQQATDGAPVEYAVQGGDPVYIDKLETGGVVKDKDGNPVAAGTLTLADGQVLTIGENGTITDIKPAEKPADAQMTPAQMREIAAKLAEGTPEERIGKHELLLKAFMNYAFGWDIQQETKNAAIAVYKESYAGQFQAVVDENKQLQTKLAAATQSLAELAGVVEGLLNLPSVEPLEKPKTMLSADDKTDKLSKWAAICSDIATQKPDQQN